MDEEAERNRKREVRDRRKGRRKELGLWRLGFWRIRVRVWRWEWEGRRRREWRVDEMVMRNESGRRKRTVRAKK